MAEKVDYSNLTIGSNFVITEDKIDNESNATEEQKAQIKKDGYTSHFKIYDDDDEHYYSGYLKGEDEGSEDAFKPLDDYGMPNAGATDIKYRNADGTYSSL